MAGHGESMRVKLSFESLQELKRSLPAKVWMLVDLEQTKSVLDLERAVLDKFSLPWPIQLYLDGCLLPSWECVNIVRENEEICVLQAAATTGVEKSTAEEISEVFVVETPTDFASGTNLHDEPRKKKKKKRKHSEIEPDLVVGNVSPVFSKSLCETETKKNSQKLIDETVTQTVIEGKQDHSENQLFIEDLDGPPDEDTTKSTAKEKPESSIMDITIQKTLEALSSSCVSMNVTPSSQQEDSGGNSKSRKRRRTRKCKNKNKLKSTQNSSEPQSPHTSTPLTLKGVVCEERQQGQKSVDYRVSQFGAVHVKFGNSDEEEGEVHTSPETGQPQSSVDANSTPAEVMHGSTGKDEVPQAVHDGNNVACTILTPNSSLARKTSYQSGASEPQGTFEVVSSKSREPNVTCVTTLQKGPFASAMVFNRKKNKKASSVPLTKEEQLRTVATNQSVIYHNHSVDDSTASSSGENRNTKLAGSASEVKQSNGKTSPCVKDYSLCSDLIGPPRVGDIIAYKVLEMSEDYCPEVSGYKEAKVLGYDSESKNVEIELLTVTQNNRKNGRFDVLIEDEDGIITNTEDPEMRMTIHWSALIQPKLVS